MLAEDVTAAVSLPSFDNSGMDGYAVQAADTDLSSERTAVTLPVTGEIAAGDTATYRLRPGTAIKIMTGARLPAGRTPWCLSSGRTAAPNTSRSTAASSQATRYGSAGGDAVAGETLLAAGRADAADADRGGGVGRARRDRGPATAAGRGAVHRQRAHRTRDAAGARPDLGLQQLHARGGRPRGRRGSPTAARSSPTTRRACCPPCRSSLPRPTCWSPPAGSAWAANTTSSRPRCTSSARSPSARWRCSRGCRRASAPSARTGYADLHPARQPGQRLRVVPAVRQARARRAAGRDRPAAAHGAGHAGGAGALSRRAGGPTCAACSATGS